MEREKFNGIIRPLERGDAEAVGRIFDMYWQDSFRTNLSQKLAGYLNNDPTLLEQKFKFFVAEEGGEVVGVAAMRTAPGHMTQFANTSNPAEFYVAAAKERGRGIGKALINKILEEAGVASYTEIVLFSGEAHQDSWPLYDKHFKRLDPTTAPNGEPGFIWRKVL
jgi:predicted N-acetyltransferase YhbS